MSKLVYISGPMSGLKGNNYPAFRDATEDLRKRGYFVISPHELDADRPTIRGIKRAEYGTPLGYAQCIGGDIAEILWGVDAIVVLPGWRISRGAAIETFVGFRILGAPVLHYGLNDPLEHVSALALDRAHLAIRG